MKNKIMIVANLISALVMMFFVSRNLEAGNLLVVLIESVVMFLNITAVVGLVLVSTEG